MELKLIAGEGYGLKSKIETKMGVFYFDVKLNANCSFDHLIKKGWNSLLFIYQGKLIFNQTEHEEGSVLQFSKDDSDITVSLKTNLNSAFIFLGGEPLNEPVV